MNNSIKLGSEFKAEDIKYATPKTMSQGGKNVKILDKYTNSWLCISTPLMLSFGISDFVDPSTGLGNGRYELSQLFPSPDYQSEESRLFLENMKSFENKIKADALKNSKDWFGKIHKSADVVDALWTPMLKYPKDKTTGEYNYDKQPSLKSKVNKNNKGEWKCEIYSEEQEILFPSETNPDIISPLDLLKSNKKIIIATVLVCGGIWFTNGKFTVTWELAQAIMKKPKENVLGQKKCFINLKPIEKELLQKQEIEDEEEEIIFEDKLSKSTMVDEDKEDENFEEEGNEEIKEEIKEEMKEEEPKKKKVIKKKSVN